MLTAVLGLGGCGGPEMEEVDLLAVAPPPDVLTEQVKVAPPTRDVGTRFVRGWAFHRSAAGMTISPIGDEAVIEVARVRQQPRTLVLEAAGAADHTSTVTVTCLDRDLGTYAVGRHTEIPLPADLTIGRVPVVLRFGDPRQVTLRGATVAPRARPGAVDLADGELSQTGFSALEVTVMVEPGSELAGTFAPPSDPRPGQRFALTVEGDRMRTVLAWSAREGRADPVSFSARLVEGPEPRAVRISLLAQGVGPPATWRGLALRRPRPTPQPHITPAHPPRLVVLYVLDALRADALGAFGGRPETAPFLDQLAADGAAFERHFSVAPNTAPSTKALFTGHTSLSGGALPEDGPETLAEAFADAGFRTAAITSNPYFARELGLGRGFEHVAVLPIAEDFRRDAPATVNDSAELVNNTAAAWLETVGPGERAFLYIHSLNPHNPYTPPAPFTDRFAADGASWLDGTTATLVRIRDGERSLTPAEVERLRALYLGGVAYNDAEIRSFIERLRTRFPERDVLVVVTADHGEELADHGGLFHGRTLYDEVMRIPLIVHWKGVVRPRRIARLTDSVDLHHTLAALAAPARAAAGRSLWPDLLGGQAAAGEAGRIVFAAAPGLKHGYMARSARWKVIVAHRQGLDFGMGEGRGRTHDPEYVFDLARDPGERRNLVGTTAPEAAWLRAGLEAWVQRHQEDHPPPAPSHLDRATLRRLEALGYRE